jgi:hypothetical protein
LIKFLGALFVMVVLLVCVILGLRGVDVKNGVRQIYCDALHEKLKGISLDGLTENQQVRLMFRADDGVNAQVQERFGVSRGFAAKLIADMLEQSPKPAGPGIPAYLDAVCGDN